MSNQKWTDEQLEAIQARNCNLLVAAAAGSGKTAVLVERIIRRITDTEHPVDIDKLLVVTFTKAAAAEMRERINLAITAALEKNPESEHLNRQLVLLNRASITTLHSFCLEVLRQFFYRIKLDPGFRVADDGEAALLKLDVLEKLFEDFYAAENREFLALVDAYGGEKDDSYLQDMVLRLWEFSRSTPFPETWLCSLMELYQCSGASLEKTEWGKLILDWINIQLEGCMEKIMQAIQTAESPGGPEPYTETLKQDLLLVDDLMAAAQSWDDLYFSFATLEFGKLKAIRDKELDEEKQNRVKNLREEVKKILKAIRTEYFTRSPEDYLADLGQVAAHVITLAGLVIEFNERYAGAKGERSLVDFSDLEQYCLQILLDEGSEADYLIPSAAAWELKGQFTEIYIDEFQDINGVQETILKLLSGEWEGSFNRFMVGDVKQSIYGFRLADPQLFRSKYQSYGADQYALERKIDLRRNFRSSAEVIDGVNYIFRQVMNTRTGQYDYDTEAELVCGTAYPSDDTHLTVRGPVELHLIEKAGQDLKGEIQSNPEGAADAEDEAQDELSDALNDLDYLQKEARIIVSRIKDLMAGQEGGKAYAVYDKQCGGLRPVRYRDIVILLRTTRNAANTFIEEFRKAGIPAFAELGTGYFDAIEIETLLSLLKIIDNPHQDIPLAAVLRSPIVGLNAQELAETRLRKNDGDFYEAVRESAEAGETAGDLKLRSFLANLEIWRTLSRQGSLAELIWRLFNETGYYTYVGAMPGGAQRQANLRAFYDRARQYEKSTFRGLFRFLRFIERFREEGNDLGTTGALGEKEDVVRVISIHKSKGLEFPIVFIAGMGRQFNRMDLREKAVFHKQLGLGLPVVDTEQSLTYPTIVQKGVKLRLQMDMLAEEMRVLYVAMTRAKEKLVLVGSARNLAREAQKWGQTFEQKGWALPDYLLMSAKSYLDWVGPAVIRHREGRMLSELAGMERLDGGFPWADGSGWKIIQYDAAEPVFAAEETEWQGSESLLEKVRELEPVAVEVPAYGEVINRNLTWQYPHEALAGKSAKASVTELKRRFAGEPDGEEAGGLTAEDLYTKNTPEGVSKIVYRRPAFVTAKTGLSAAERGSAMHLAMQHLDFANITSPEDIIMQLEDMAVKELLTFSQFEAIDIPNIWTFVKSPLGERIKNASAIRREVPFIIGAPASRFYTELADADEEKVMIQGIIDCLVEEADGFLLIDYKSDDVWGESLEEMAKQYQSQLDAYAWAVETILQQKVKEKYLYFFKAGSAVRC